MFGTGVGLVAGAVLVVPIWSMAPASAATVIYYSAPENTYGWCAGYGYDRGHSCAKRYCVDAGGTACEMAVECSGGWGAIAFAQDPATGFGASCNGSNAYSARSAALTICVTVSRTLCWTESTFSRNASTASDADNNSFDMTYYAQAMLQLRHYETGSVDGRLGAQTRAAIAEFQTKLAMPATGVLDDALFSRLLDAVGGTQQLAKAVKRSVYDPIADELRDYAYGHASSPAPERSFSEELMERSPDERRMALATVLASGSTECTPPAVDVELIGDAPSGMWSIECVEGSYTLIMSEGSRLIMRGGVSKAEPETEPEPEQQQSEQQQTNPAPQPRGGHRRR